jgi:phage I-like protein
MSGREHLALAADERSAARLTFAARLEPSADPELVTIHGVEYVKGKPLHIFPSGAWQAVDGRHVEFNAADAKAMIDDLQTRQSDVAITYDHETDKKRGSAAGGWMRPTGFEWRADSGLWANDVFYTKNAYFGDSGNDQGGIAGGEWRYVSGDALGIGNAHADAPFHPRRLLATALVPKPGFVRGLQGIQLSANDNAALSAWLKESPMSETPKIQLFSGWKTRAEFCSAVKLAADASDEQTVAAFKTWLDEEGGEPEHKDALAKKFGTLDDGTVLNHKKGDCKDPNCEHFAAHTKGECPNPKTCDTHEPDADDEEAKMGAETKTPATGADPNAVAEKFAALGKKIAEDTLSAGTITATKAAMDAVEARFAAEVRTKETETLIDAALTDGRLSGDALAKVARKTFSISMDDGKAFLEALPKPAIAPGASISPRNACIIGGASGGRFSRDVMFNPDGKPNYSAQSDFLSAVMRFGAETGAEPKQAMEAVLKGDNAAFEKLLGEADGRDAKDFRKGSFGAFRPSFRPTEFDIEKAKYIRARLLDGALSDKVVPTAVQQFASIGDFQPAARTTLPMGLGYPQADFVGDLMLPVFVGGSDESAAWPEYSFEKFAAIGEAVGILGAPVWSSLNVVWHRVTLEKFAVGTKIDRRLRAASVTLPEGIDTTALENLRGQVGTTKEVAQATFMTTNGNYFDSSYYPTMSPKWDAADSPAAYAGLPVNDITAGLLKVRNAVRVAPDLFVLSYAAALAMRKNQQVIDTVRFTGTQERPGTMVSNATLAALFAGMFNLTIVVAEAGAASLPSGAPVSDAWGKDAFLVCTGAGKTIAPRFGMTVVAGGRPTVRAFPEEILGADGTDDIVVTDSWSLASINNKAAYRLVGAAT